MECGTPHATLEPVGMGILGLGNGIGVEPLSPRCVNLANTGTLAQTVLTVLLARTLSLEVQCMREGEDGWKGGSQIASALQA